MSEQNKQKQEKVKVAKFIAKHILENRFQIIGIGTGSTVDLVLDELKENRGSCNFVAATSSYESTKRCLDSGIRVVALNAIDENIPFGFDGADGVDEKLRLIKGKGAALFREKILANYLSEFWIAVDSTKLVEDLAQIAIPVEISPEAINYVSRQLASLPHFDSLSIRQATGKHGAIITELGNVIIDAKFTKIDDDLEAEIKKITGVIESGLFTKHASQVVSVVDGEILVKARG